MMMKQAVKKIINASLKSRGFRLCRTDDQTGSTWEYDYLHNQIDDLKMLSSKMVIDHMNADIDGNDYWIWQSLDVVKPVITIVEYNSVFGDKHAITIPYDRAFNRTKAHYSNLYWGASLRALCILAEQKGYVFVGSNSSGNNAYFVKQTKLAGSGPALFKRAMWNPSLEIRATPMEA